MVQGQRDKLLHHQLHHDSEPVYALPSIYVAVRAAVSYTGDARFFFRFSIFFDWSPRFASAADAAEAVFALLWTSRDRSPLFTQQILRKSRHSQLSCSLDISSFCASRHFLANHIRAIRGLVYFVASAVGLLRVLWLWKPFDFLFCFPEHCRFGPLFTI